MHATFNVDPFTVDAAQCYMIAGEILESEVRVTVRFDATTSASAPFVVLRPWQAETLGKALIAAAQIAGS